MGKKNIWNKPFIVLDEIEKEKSVHPNIYEAALYQNGTTQNVKNHMVKGNLAYGRYRTISYDSMTWRNLKGYKEKKVEYGFNY